MAPIVITMVMSNNCKEEYFKQTESQILLKFDEIIFSKSVNSVKKIVLELYFYN